MIVRLNAVKSSIRTSAWAVVDGKRFLSPLVAESRLQNVAVSSLGLETMGIHRYLVCDIKSKKTAVTGIYSSNYMYFRVKRL